MESFFLKKVIRKFGPRAFFSVPPKLDAKSPAMIQKVIHTQSYLCDGHNPVTEDLKNYDNKPTRSIDQFYYYY